MIHATPQAKGFINHIQVHYKVSVTHQAARSKNFEVRPERYLSEPTAIVPSKNLVNLKGTRHFQGLCCVNYKIPGIGSLACSSVL